jgi:predicted transcriptional regulator
MGDDHMPTTKEKVRSIVDQLPDNCTIQEVIYRLYVLDKINRGIEALDAGESVPHDVAMKELREWLSASSGPNQPSKT